MIIRKAEPADAEKLLKMLNELDNENSFMMFESGERQATVGQMTDRINGYLKSSSSECSRGIVLLS